MKKKFLVILIAIPILAFFIWETVFTAKYLEESGYENVANVIGGIDAWSLEVDSKVPRY